jgi:hypothetical protein
MTFWTKVMLVVSVACATAGLDRPTMAVEQLAAGEAAASTEKTAADVPKPEKDNSFAYDTYMRRNKYPLSIVVLETEGKGGQNVPVTLSVGCGEGDYPAGQLTPVLDGKALPAQLDVLATWPKDGSIKHALVNVMLPALAPKQRLVLTFKKEAPTVPGKFVPALDVKDLAFRTQFDDKDGAKTTTAIDAETLAQIAGP